jgi:hypothetical protein
VERVIADAGKGLERGVKLACAARQAGDEEHEQAPARPLTMGLEVFHTQHELQRVLQQKWRQAERA